MKTVVLCADDFGISEGVSRGILELAVGGLASIPGVASVIAGATSPEQVRANASAGAWHASEADLDAIARAVA